MKKFLTVLLVIAVMFTFSFGSAFAATADEALAQALASAKESAVQALNKLVNVNDYDAEGQAEIKELIEEGTMLINLQTDVNGVTTTLAAYQTKLIGVDNADANAVEAAKKAAKESIADYIDALEATGQYATNAFATIASTYTAANGDIDDQATVIGVELVLAQAYAAIEKVEMGADNVNADAEVAKSLAAAKALAINTVKGLTNTGADWATVDATKSTKEQVAAYKAKVAEVVAAIKAATTETAVTTILAREKAEVEELALYTEKDLAQETFEDELYAWGHGLVYTAYDSTDYATIKAYVENITFADGNNWLKLNGYWVDDANGVNVAVAEMDDVKAAVKAAKAWINDKLVAEANITAAETTLSTLKTDVNAAVADELAVAVTDAMYLSAIRDLETAATQAELDAKVAAYAKEWKAAAKALDVDYQTAVANAQAQVNTWLAGMESKTTWTSGAATAFKDLTTVVLAELQNDRNYPAGYDDTDSFTALESFYNATGAVTLGSVGINVATDSYTALLADFQGYLVGLLNAVDLGSSDAAEKAEDAEQAKVNATTTIPAAYEAFNAGLVAYANYVEGASKAEFDAFKAAEALVTALPDEDEVTLNDKAAVVAAYKAFVKSGSVYTDAYEEAYDTTYSFIGETAAAAKIRNLYELVTGTNTGDTTETALSSLLATFKSDALSNYLNTTAYAEYSAEKQAALTAAYEAGIAAISAAAYTGYADDVTNVVADAYAAMAKVADNDAIEALAKLIADAKAFLGGCYDAAEYSAEGLAKIAEIIATVDGSVNARAVANKTIAARKAIAAVTDTVESEALNKALKDIEIKAYLQDLEVVARSAKTAKGNVKVTINADVAPIIEAGYTVEYKFYRSTKSNKGFGAAKKVSAENTYTNTKGEKGTKYFYKAVIVAKDAEGTVIASTPLKHCLYASRTWTK